MARSNVVLLVAVLVSGLCLSSRPAAQERYDGEEPYEKLHIRLGGFQQSNFDSTIRLDSKELGLGTVLELEDSLAVDKKVTVGRLDGFYRFNPRHRIEWSFFRTDRKGDATVIDEAIQIGDTIFEVGAQVSSEWKSGIAKISYAYSFVNVRKYEFYAGVGLNVRDLSFRFAGSGAASGGASGSFDETYEADGLAPLPTFTFGGRWNFTPKLTMRGRAEFFALEVGDFGGRLQDSLLLLDYDITKNFGIGLGANSYAFKLDAETEDLRGELETTYLGALLYLTFGF